jgi:hypothetical protein
VLQIQKVGARSNRKGDSAFAERALDIRLQDASKRATYPYDRRRHIDARCTGDAVVTGG